MAVLCVLPLFFLGRVFSQLHNLRAPKHYGIGDLYLEAVCANAHLDVIFNLEEGLSRQGWTEFIVDAGHEFAASCMCCAHQEASKAKEARETRKPTNRKNKEATEGQLTKEVEFTGRPELMQGIWPKHDVGRRLLGGHSYCC